MRLSVRLGAGLLAVVLTAVAAISLAGGRPAGATPPLGGGTPSERAPSCVYQPPCPPTPAGTPTPGPTVFPNSSSILGGGGPTSACNDVSEQRWTAPGMPILCTSNPD